MSKLFSATANSVVAGEETNGSKATVRKSTGQGLSQLWRKRNKIRIFKCYRGRIVFNQKIWSAEAGVGNRPYRQQWKLCTRQYSVCNTYGKQFKQTVYRIKSFFTEILALCKKCGNSEFIRRIKSQRDYTRCGNGSIRETKKLAVNSGKVRVYDIRNAGRHHRFTVSGKLVHNCGYGGSVGALKNMGAVEMGVQENELQGLINDWRNANPHIVRFWYEVGNAAMKAIKEKTTVPLGKLVFAYERGILFIRLPSGRRLSYIKPRIGTNRFGGDSITYMGINSAKKWDRLETFGGKLTENIVQGTARDLLANALINAANAGYDTVFHVHDEIICEVPNGYGSVDELCKLMCIKPEWADGLPLNADGFECEYYKKE